MKQLDFKFNEVLSFFEHAKQLGLTPTLTIHYRESYRYEFAWITLAIKDCRMYTRIYDKEWLFSRIKHYINKANHCPYGDIRIVKVRE